MPTAHHHRFLPTALLLLLTVTVVQCGLNLGLTDKHGTTLNSAECNPQTTVDFGFSTVTTATSASAVVSPSPLRPTPPAPPSPSSTSTATI